MEKESSNNSESKNMLIKLCNKCFIQQRGTCTKKEMKEVCNICGAKNLINNIY